MNYSTYGRCFNICNDAKIRLLESKSHAYRVGFSRAIAKGDKEAAGKWKEGFESIRVEIDELKNTDL